jgi:hypothetical protein
LEHAEELGLQIQRNLGDFVQEQALGQAVAVVGQAGVGKSRLVWEFTRSPTGGWCSLTLSATE